MSIFDKKFIDTTEDVEDTEEVKEEENMEQKLGFFARHKKGILIGAGTALAALIGCGVMAKRNADNFDDEYEDDDLVTDDTPSDTGSADTAE